MNFFRALEDIRSEQNSPELRFILCAYPWYYSACPVKFKGPYKAMSSMTFVTYILHFNQL